MRKFGYFIKATLRRIVQNIKHVHEKSLSPNPIFNGTFVIKIFHSEQRLIAAFCRKINICKNLMRTANRFLPFWPVQGAEKKISPNPIFDGTFVIKIFRSEQRLLVAFCRKIKI